MTDQEKPAVEQKVKNALAQIRPYLQQDGGDVEYVDMTAEGVVIVRLKGHCGLIYAALGLAALIYAALGLRAVRRYRAFF